MTNPIDPNVLGPLSIQGTEVPSANKPAQAEPQGPAFKALLERLQEQARELQDTSRDVEQPADLAKAVDRAHDSLEAALSFGDQLLEAYREQLHRPPGTDVDSGDGETGR
jgi:flagellar hook-basal body complex protein FliE